MVSLYTLLSMRYISFKKSLHFKATALQTFVIYSYTQSRRQLNVFTILRAHAGIS